MNNIQNIYLIQNAYHIKRNEVCKERLTICVHILLYSYNIGINRISPPSTKQQYCTMYINSKLVCKYIFINSILSQ